MPNMPVLPALSQPAGTPGPLTDVLDGMAEQDVADLCAVAAEWADSAGLDPEVVDDPEATAEPDDDTPTEEPLPGDTPVNHAEDESLEDEAAEPEEIQDAEAETGSENFDGLLGQVQAEAAKAEAFVTQFDDLIEQAKAAEDEGGDPDAVESLKDEASDFLDEVAGLLKEAESARQDEDAEGIAQAGLMIKEKLEIVETLVAQAQIHAKTNTPAAPTEGSIPTATPALALWAQRYGAV